MRVRSRSEFLSKKKITTTKVRKMVTTAILLTLLISCQQNKYSIKLTLFRRKSIKLFQFSHLNFVLKLHQSTSRSVPNFCD